MRGPRFRAAAAVSVPIHTDPGEEIQFDFCNLDHIAAAWGWDHPLRVFGAISSWSRQRLWWFTTSEDREHTFEGIVRAFEAFGGVPAVARRLAQRVLEVASPPDTCVGDEAPQLPSIRRSARGPCVEL